MAKTSKWSFPENLQPKSDEVQFDLAAALDAVVMLHSEIPEDAFTASILGTERLGNGVVIRPDGLVLTMGYLITEAENIWLTAANGAVFEGFPLAYDFSSGFGLVQPLGKMSLPALERGSSADCMTGDEVYVIGHGGRGHALRARLIAKREFAGYWEYVLDEALFTAPAHPQWGGAAVLDSSGQLIGIGSLLVQEQVDGEIMQANMIVPIDLLEPILDDMLKMGQVNRAPRPWLGMYTTEERNQLIVAGVVDDGPADRAGVQQGDQVIEVAGQRPESLADLFHCIWRLGSAGIEVPLTLSRQGEVVQVRVISGNRADYLKKPQMH
ncbi:MAG TPA: S1C family serine protease [Burkholderiales bacterium]|nr:S1C family serine protease [Burkholderiales bacterium]